MQKGYFEDMMPLLQLISLLAIIALSLIILTSVGFVLLFAFQGVNETISSFSSNDAGSLRYFQIVQSFAVFVIPSAIAAFLFSKNPAKQLGFFTPKAVLILLALVMFIACQPLISFLTELNKSIIFPDFLKSIESKMRLMEDTNNNLIFRLLDTKKPFIIILNVFMVVILPAFGEEMLFRGMIQPLFGKLFKNGHIAVWLTAFIFSAIHLQFLTFLPRLILGAFLGYLFLYTKNIWYPIAAHFVNNLISTIIFYHYRFTQPDINPINEPAEKFGWLIITASFIAVGLLMFIFIKKKKCISH